MNKIKILKYQLKPIIIMNLKIMLATMVAISMLVSSCSSSQKGDVIPEQVTLTNGIDSVSYALGVNIGTSLVRNDLPEVNPVIFAAGLKKVLSNDTVGLMSIEETQMVIQEFQMGKEQSVAIGNREAANAFLTENATKEGVVTTASGLQYKVISQGNGPIAQPGQVVVAHYHGTLIDGTVFDSSVDRGSPFEFPLGQGRVIRGWDEAFSIMPVGSKWTIYLSPDLAYGDSPRQGGPIKPGMALIFEVELLEVKAELTK
jgi:FKBP-type peptidyl-prolyl cis-trans isomerase FklB